MGRHPTGSKNALRGRIFLELYCSPQWDSAALVPMSYDHRVLVRADLHCRGWAKKTKRNSARFYFSRSHSVGRTVALFAARDVWFVVAFQSFSAAFWEGSSRDRQLLAVGNRYGFVQAASPVCAEPSAEITALPEVVGHWYRPGAALVGIVFGLRIVGLTDW